MKLVFDGEVPAYHPASGVTLIPGEAEYDDAKAEQLIAAGLRKPRAKTVTKEGKE